MKDNSSGNYCQKLPTYSYLSKDRNKVKKKTKQNGRTVHSPAIYFGGRKVEIYQSEEEAWRIKVP